MNAPDRNMKLFAIEAHGNYGSGVAVIRAASVQEAREIAAKIKGSASWNIRYDRPADIRELSATDDGLLYLFESGE